MHKWSDRLLKSFWRILLIILAIAWLALAGFAGYLSLQDPESGIAAAIILIIIGFPTSYFISALLALLSQYVELPNFIGWIAMVIGGIAQWAIILPFLVRKTMQYIELRRMRA